MTQNKNRRLAMAILSTSNLNNKLSHKTITITEKGMIINTVATLSAKAQTQHKHHEDRKSHAKTIGIGKIIEKEATPESVHVQTHHKHHNDRTSSHKPTTGARTTIGNAAIPLQAQNYKENNKRTSNKTNTGIGTIINAAVAFLPLQTHHKHYDKRTSHKTAPTAVGTIINSATDSLRTHSDG